MTKTEEALQGLDKSYALLAKDVTSKPSKEWVNDRIEKRTKRLTMRDAFFIIVIVGGVATKFF
jgi:hypothetical protein